MTTTVTNKPVNINLDERSASYINHISHIQNIPNPEQIQYMSYTHSLAWTFNKEKKCKSNKKFF